MSNILYVIGCMILGAIVGSIFGGYIEDVSWYAGNQSLPNCDQIEGESWKDHCYTINKTYYSTKILYQTIGGLSPLIVGTLFILRMR
ncbi:MAG: hypothetical protein HKM23_09640 [Nitrosopumilus sp.]|nr:hypothetical protein [Nitrosopumilus sp.]NNM36092.1 hypothetical protein [Nitrosopumilus sp.]